MKTSLVITIALFTIFTISEISCNQTCSKFNDNCINDSDCCSNNCYMAGHVNDRYCMDPINATAAVKVGLGLCSYNSSFHRESSNDTFKYLGITAAHSILPVGTEIKLTNSVNNISINAVVNNYLQPNNETLVELSKEAARELGVKDGEIIPCSLYINPQATDYSTFKKMIGFSVSFFVVAFLVFTFL